MNCPGLQDHLNLPAEARMILKFLCPQCGQKISVDTPVRAQTPKTEEQKQ
ncbi:hypothetical protein CfE428DRAFT_5510 [Chthoniobacter flavus Ellin428]|uniref:Uncharacterized protein n=1 Tax=Chthoniobacter flavus Ellin428 TaxID=497964 RepID=B4D9C0_9BACT|nr:hypothetical protein CfE428DRAFT_5510 [Chthoniobacter flavus Ellin428]TCO87763.1 hypothetical protein EV701_12062 [Chthoniobacter flavus]